ncbi:molybdopterin-binding protein [Desulfolithobacter dissulfuricans]|uniref:Molybdopterin molybdenumtransferase n=1 Tax=Desulfolithobacter dissulfuricans TaxID=2795293 RepID=A0A915U1S2_9BACT|nr:molybdopterin-binding protein [Desulfolithobacter dissulfuricans]BCO09798.1 molybdopterin-binding protein [Desulfolithobacter dissulfuricans]
MITKKTIPVDQAVGMVLPHDITEIVKDEFKGRAFKKGHIIQPRDVEHLRRLGKENIYVLELGPGEIHENEAAALLAEALAGEGTQYSDDVVEGKITIKAACDGLLKINREALLELNLLGEVMCATLHDNTPVKRGEQVAATRLIPLVGERRLVDQAVRIAGGGEKIIRVLPLKKVRAGLVITGSEVFYGRIEDKFEKVLRTKLAKLGSEVGIVRFAPDDPQQIAAEIQACLDSGAELIVTSGGMSVDPDDVTRLGIREAGAEDMVYGSPVLPGAMFLVSRIGQVPVLGLPACGMFHSITVLDLLLPRILAGETIGRRELADMGHGGLCRNCKKCQYPVCPFGK